MILAIETATDVCSVALERGRVIVEKRSDEHGSHSENLFLFIQQLLDESNVTIDELETVLVSAGPGSYTGLRIAASGVKGILFGREIPLQSVSTLASFAWSGHEQAPDATKIHAIIDARRHHLYHQSFKIDSGQMVALTEIAAKPIKKIQEMLEAGDVLVGTGFSRLDVKNAQNLHTFGKDVITAKALVDLYHKVKNRNFIKQVPARQFDPDYYSSSQLH